MNSQRMSRNADFILLSLTVTEEDGRALHANVEEPLAPSQSEIIHNLLHIRNIKLQHYAKQHSGLSSSAKSLLSFVGCGT